MNKYIVLGILCLLCLACGKRPETSSNKKTTTITQEQIDNLLENQSFSCSSLDGQRCPGGVARVFVLNLRSPSASGVCTGFLVRSNRLVTNHHCLSTADECSSTYVSVYNGDSFESAKCKRIVQAFDDGKPLSKKAVDYAVIELDHHVRSSDTFNLSLSGVSVGELVNAWVVDHLDLFRGRITQLACSVNKVGGSIEVANCPAISGNSGSPVTNSRGEVIGVLWGSTTPDSVNEETPLDRRRPLSAFSYITDTKHFRRFTR